MTSYVNQYGTEFAVQKHDGAPALMCRQRDSSQWTLSGSLANLVGDAKTAKDLQAILDRAAKEKGWEPVRGFPDWELPMVKEILTWPWMPKTAEEFTSSFFKSCDAVRARGGGSCAAGLYDTGPQGIKFSKFYQDGRLYAEHTWPDFVRRCIAQGIAPVPNADPTSAGPESNAAESGAGSEGLPAAESAVLPAGQKNADEECPHLEPLENSKKYTCKCSICGDKFPNREICNKSFKSCGWYQDWCEKENKKHRTDCQCRTCEKESCFAHGCDKECPENAESTCLTTNCPEYQGKKDGTPCTACRCPECDDDACPQAQCDGSDKGLGCIAPDDDCPPQNPTAAAPASRADAGAAAQSLSAAGPASLEAPPSGSSAFDYSGLNDQTVAVLHLAESEIREARQVYICRVSAAVAAAHDAVVANCENGEGGKFTVHENTFLSWCASVGLKKDAAYRLLQVNDLLTGSTPEEQATLEAASPSLLYAAAKPSAPAELVQAVKDGDITTHKQYQEALAEIRARDAKIKDLLEMSEAADRRAEEEERKRKEAEKKVKGLADSYATAHKNEEFSIRNLKKAQQERDEAIKERDGARDALKAVKMRADKWQAEAEAAKANPIEAKVVDEAEVNRRAQELADKQTADLRQRLADLQAVPSDAEEASRDAYDAVVYTCRTIENSWKAVKPLLQRMDPDTLPMAANQLATVLHNIENEVRACQ